MTFQVVAAGKRWRVVNVETGARSAKTHATRALAEHEAFLHEKRKRYWEERA